MQKITKIVIAITTTVWYYYKGFAPICTRTKGLNESHIAYEDYTFFVDGWFF